MKLEESKATKKIHDEIRELCTNYMELMSDCARYEVVREDFIARPHWYLTERVGMRIPKNAAIVLDDSELRWPLVYIHADGKTYTLKEGNLHMDITVADLTSGKITEQVEETKTGVVKYDLSKLKHADVVVVIPFFDAKVDILSDIKLANHHEIVLSCC